MPWFGSWLGSEGSGQAFNFPPLTTTTTEDLIRDRIEAVIRAQVPTVLERDTFRPYQNEGEGDFRGWAESLGQGAFRRFQVRFDGTGDSPEVSNCDFEERIGRFEVLIAYPHSARTGAKQAVDRDKAIDRDYDLMKMAIGLYGRSNFIPPYPDAGFHDWSSDREPGKGCDFLVIGLSMSFRRALFG